MRLTIKSARALHLAAQGLLSSPVKAACPEDVLSCIRQMSALQIDTINVVARSPYLVLWSRLGDYSHEWLDKHLEDGNLFEYWSHEACFLPIEDYGLYRHQMISPHGLGWKYNQRWATEQKENIAAVRAHIKKYGATRSADFERTDGKSGGWWEWKPEKRSLEVLFTTGELMVSKRHHFQRHYDLRERVHPTWKDKKHLAPQLDCQRQQVLLAIRALGIAKKAWVADYFRMGKIDKSISPEVLAKQGSLITARVDSWNEDVYIHPDHADLVSLALKGELKSKVTTLLSPFDPVVWDRRRALELFGFDYKLECYTPAAKRRYGYFTLPILRKGELIGRLDAKAHRKEGIFEIKALFLEEKVRFSQGLAQDIGAMIERFAAWHQTPTIELKTCSDANLAEKLVLRFSALKP